MRLEHLPEAVRERREPQPAGAGTGAALDGAASGQVRQPSPPQEQGLIAEMKRRRVFRTAIGYGVAAFAVLQVIEPIMHGLHWPEQVLTYVVVALSIGFPVVVALAWLYDVNAGRIERTPPARLAGLRGLRLAILLIVTSAVAALPGLGWYLFMRGR